MDFNSNETVEFKKTIEDIVSAQFYREGVTKYVAAKITAVNSDGTFNAIIPPDDEVEVVGLLNKSNDALQVGDSVELVTKNGKLSNAWISAKHKKNHFGFTYSPDGQNRGLFDYDVNDWIFYKDANNALHIPKLVDIVYPIGSVYLTTSASNPSSLLGFGTWEQISQGRVLIGVGTGTDSNSTSKTYAVGDTGGEYTHKLTLTEAPSHQHDPDTATWGFLAYVPSEVERVRVGTNTSGRYAFLSTAASSAADSGLQYANRTNSKGGDGYHNNIQPYYAVYIWRRTA